MSTFIGAFGNAVWCGPLMVQISENTLQQQPQLQHYTVDCNYDVKRALLVITHSSIASISWTTRKGGIMKRVKSVVHFAWRHSVRSGQARKFFSCLKDAIEIYR